MRHIRFVAVCPFVFAALACGSGPPKQARPDLEDAEATGGAGGTGGIPLPPVRKDAATDDVSPAPDAGSSADLADDIDRGDGAQGMVVTDGAVNDDTGPQALPPFPLDAIKAAKPQKLASANTQLENPSWRITDGSLFFSADGPGFGLMRIAPDGKLYRYHPYPTLQPIGNHVMADGRMLMCDHQADRTVLLVFPDGSIGVINHDYNGKTIDFCNDIDVDGDGNIYLSQTHTGEVFRITPAGEVALVAAHMASPNGLAVDPASKYLYVAAGGGIQRFTLPKGGGTDFGAPVQVKTGGPDGMVFDIWGNIWGANYSAGQIEVYDPEKRQTIVKISAGASPVTCPAFGGKDRDTLYTTVANNGVYKIGPIPGMRGFLHPGAPKYAIKTMLTATPADQLVK
jgi:sugar lactone lactonase YvrE